MTSIATIANNTTNSENPAQPEILLQTLFPELSEPLLLLSAEGRISHVSKSFLSCTGLSREQLLEQPLDFFSPQGLVNSPAGPIYGEKISSLVIDGAKAGSCRLELKPLFHGRRLLAYLALLSPEGENGKSLPCKREGFDQLTSLPNRYLFIDRVEQGLHQARRNKSSVAVIMMGVDNFSRVTEALGDAAGDIILRELGQRLLRCARSSDTVARLAGDRFAVLMQISSANDSVTVAEKVIGAFSTPFVVSEDEEVALTCSVGIGVFPADADSVEGLIQCSSLALQHAKRDGNNLYQFFSSQMNDHARNRLEVETGLRRALSNNELVVYYQPKIHVESGRVAGMEALVRWRDPYRGLIPPGQFIPVAEESALIEQLGQWVLFETCRQNRCWQDEGINPLRVSVNVSARQFRNRLFVETVREVLEETGLEPCWLELEITESLLMGEMDAVVERMESLRDLGISLSIDDFGTGYSSLSYLGRFPITTLKIDRAFIADVQSNHLTAEIAKAIIGLSKGLNLEVVAEGAEVKEQVEFLRENGCEMVQGFYYSKPLAANEFVALVKENMKHIAN